MVGTVVGLSAVGLGFLCVVIGAMGDPELARTAYRPWMAFGTSTRAASWPLTVTRVGLVLIALGSATIVSAWVISGLLSVDVDRG
jgi:hypothetical protein